MWFTVDIIAYLGIEIYLFYLHCFSQKIVFIRKMSSGNYLLERKYSDQRNIRITLRIKDVFFQQKNILWGFWVAQSVKCLTLGFNTGPDLTVVGWSPRCGSVLSAKSPYDSLSLSLTLSLK